MIQLSILSVCLYDATSRIVAESEFNPRDANSVLYWECGIALLSSSVI